MYAPPAPFDVDRVESFEKRARKDVSIVMWYQPWAVDNRYLFDAGACVSLMRQGKVPMITWEPWNPGNNANLLRDPARQPKYRLSRIVKGEFDGYIRSWAVQIRELGGPVMLRPMHEMNGNWYPWCGAANGNRPADFRAAWRRIHRIFEAEGATNVTWVWSINHESVPSGRGNRYAAYYPGDEYVDWTAISGFNWGTSSRWSSWRSFSHWYDEPLAYLKRLRKPICIAEFACVEQGGDKGAWMADAYRRVRATPSVRAIVYYDSIERAPSSTQDWRVDTSSRSLAAFRKSIAPAYFVADPPAALSDWAALLGPEGTRYLTSLRSVY